MEVGLEGDEDDVDVGLPESEPLFEPEEEPELESSSPFPVKATGKAMARTMVMMIKRMIPRLVRGLDLMRSIKDGLVLVLASPAPRSALRSSSDRTWNLDILQIDDVSFGMDEEN